MLNVLGISAPSHGCGKSTVADIIKTHVNSHYNSRSGFDHIGDYDINCKIIPFASTLKIMIGDIMNEEITHLTDKESPNPKLGGKSLRYVMQSLGAFMRNTINENVWIDAWKRRVEIFKFSSANTLVIVDDVRYENEFNILKDMGAKFIFVDRKPIAEEHHESEGNISKYACDYIIDNSKNFVEYDDVDHDESAGYEIFAKACCKHTDKIMLNFTWDEAFEPILGRRWQ